MKRGNIYTTKVYSDKRINIRLVSKRLKRLKKIILFIDSNGKLRIKIHNKANRKVRCFKKRRPLNGKKRSRHSERKKGVMTDINEIVVVRDPPISNQPIVITTTPQVANNPNVAINPTHTMVNRQDVSSHIQQGESSTELAERPHQLTDVHPSPGEAISGSNKNMLIQIFKENTITLLSQMATNPILSTHPPLTTENPQDKSLVIQPTESGTGLAERPHQLLNIHLPEEAISGSSKNMPVQIVKENTITTTPQLPITPNVATHPPLTTENPQDKSLVIQPTESGTGLGERPHQLLNIHLPEEAISGSSKNMPVQIVKDNKNTPTVTNHGTVINEPALKSDPDPALANSQKSELIQIIPQEAPVVNDSRTTREPTIDAKDAKDAKKTSDPGSYLSWIEWGHKQQKERASKPEEIIPVPVAASLSDDKVPEPNHEQEPLTQVKGKDNNKLSTQEDVTVKITGENGNGSIRGSGRHNSG
ncbi:hypothetical protein [Paenibacillus forsythiae]|uniref:hypothetical protein n=1 Tax=Paenibacillus forsythiae TaxID=365616 RepID=UPI00046F2496|nr:hypothetical protein [Paenibacillus forsythiae]